MREKQMVKIIACTQASSNPAELFRRYSNTPASEVAERGSKQNEATNGKELPKAPASEECSVQDQLLDITQEIFQDFPLQVNEQDADDEAAEDTDDTSSVTSSASSTTSSKSGSGAGRKKSIPLSIRNLKRKHKKKKKGKVYREFKPGDRFVSGGTPKLLNGLPE